MKTLSDRFWAKVDKSGDCWIWTACTNYKGYGQLLVDGKPTAAHRVSWVLHFGAIPRGRIVCHSCDVRNCVRPDHLWLGTNNQNMADMVAKGRSVHRYGAANPKAKLTPAQVKFIREAKGILKTELASMFGVSHSAICHIAKGRSWVSQ